MTLPLDGTREKVFYARMLGYPDNVAIEEHDLRQQYLASVVDSSSLPNNKMLYQPPVVVMPQSGQFLTPVHASRTTAASTVNRLTFLPMVVQAATRIDQLALDVATAAATSVYRMGLYTSLNGWPSRLIVEAPGTADASTTGAKALTLTTPLTLPPGLYYAASVCQVAASTPRVANDSGPILLPSTSSANTTASRAFIQDSISGALPTTANTTPSTVAGILVNARIG